jgi:hypothetical protein
MATTAAGWKKKRVREVELPSGETVKLAKPNLPAVIKAGKLPNSLVKFALGETEAASPTDPEAAGQLADFQATLITLTVVEPKIDEDDIVDLPGEDIDFLFDYALRGPAAKEAGEESLTDFRGVRPEPAQ